jgi:histone-lysine N-methyltransferase NSD2
MPLYGEILWTKLGHYRWWPAQVMFPDELPQNVLRMPHNVGQFAVQFCGTKEFYWMNNGRCYPYQEGDSDRIPGGSGAGGSSLDSSFMKGIQEASKLYEEYMENKSKSEKLNESKVRAQPHLRPPLYTKIKSNKPYGDCVIHNSEAHLKCDCSASSNDPCGPTSNCINRLLLVECQPNVCTMGDRCGNRQFQKKLYPPMRVEHTKTKGWGLFVKTDIKKGDFIIEYVGELITNDEFKKRIGNMLNNKDADQNYYFMVIDNARVIDAGPKGNYARFINHSCDPNCETVKWTVNGDTRIGIFALEDIPANTELTFNYQFEAFGEVKKPCLCGAENCCGLIGEKAPPKRPPVNSAALVAASKKKKIKKDKKEPKISKNQYDDWCYRCYNSSTILDEEVENLILCDFKGCLKSYHLGCISRDTVPHGKWYCPWHHCVTCGKLASSWCDHCPNGYCKSHSEPLKKHPVLKNVCDEHLVRNGILNFKVILEI